MKTLVVEKPGKILLKEVPIPTYNECQALVKTVSCGICNGTDSKLIHGKFKGFSEKDYPLILGHEGVGRVIEVGKKVKSFKIGDYVLLPFVDEIEEMNSAWGAFSEYGIVNDQVAYMDAGKCPGTKNFPDCSWAQTVLPTGFDPVYSAMIITLREVMSSIKQFGIQKNKSIIVFGCGPVGLTFIKFLHLYGVFPIIALDYYDKKLEEAKKMGATYTFNNRNTDVYTMIRNIVPEGADYTLDAVGYTDIVNQSMNLIADGGKICTYGIAPDLSMQLNWSRGPYNWTLQFQQFPSKYEEYLQNNQVISWIQAGVIDMKDFISNIFDFVEILSAFDMLERKEIAKKGIVRYE